MPRNTSLNWFMPALVKSSVGSLAGASDDECTRLCPLLSKKRRNFSRISEPVGIVFYFKRTFKKTFETQRKGGSGGHENRRIARNRRHRKSLAAKGAKDATAGKDKSVISFAAFAVNLFSDSGDARRFSQAS